MSRVERSYKYTGMYSEWSWLGRTGRNQASKPSSSAVVPLGSGHTANRSRPRCTPLDTSYALSLPDALRWPRGRNGASGCLFDPMRLASLLGALDWSLLTSWSSRGDRWLPTGIRLSEPFSTGPYALNPPCSPNPLLSQEIVVVRHSGIL